MANASIRGHQGKFEVYENGKLVKLLAMKSVDVNQESTFIKSMYVGNPVPEGDQAIEGWSGSIEMEVKDAAADEFIDALVTNNLNGIGVSDYSFLDTEFYSDGTQKTYVYSDCQFKLSKKKEGLQAKQTKKLDFQAMVRQPL
jgi:hypothetical protein